MIASTTSRMTGSTLVILMDSFGASTYFYIVIVNLVVGNMSDRELWLDLKTGCSNHTCSRIRLRDR